MTFGEYYLSAFIRPHQTFEALVIAPRRLTFGMLAVTITAVLYTLVYLFLIFGDGRPFKPWLAISPEVYYHYNVYFLAPSMFMCWIVSAGVIQLLARLFSGTGSFEDTLSVLGFGISTASWSTLLHDLVTSFLGAIHSINQREYEVALNSPTIWRTLLWALMILYLVWFIILFSKGIAAAQRIKRGPSVMLGVLAFFIYQIVFLIFNR